MKKLIFVVLPLFIIGIVLNSCNKINSDEQLRQNELDLLDDFVSRYETVHKVKLEHSLSGLYFLEIAKGVGDTVKVGDKVQLWYNTYRLKDTFLFDSNMDKGKLNPLEFAVTERDLSTVVEGLNEAVKKNMQRGSKAFLIVPSEIGYGQTATSSVPAFSTLLFDIEIYKVFHADEY